jgi:uncharacterized protein
MHLLRRLLRAAALAVAVAALAAACGGGDRGEDGQDDGLRRSLVGAAESFGRGLDAYWAEHSPTFMLGAYRSPSRIVPYDRGTVPDLGCGIRNDPPEDWKHNAVYCPEDEAIAYEIELLLEEAKQFGAVPSLLVLAHEWGHHIQHLDGQLENQSLPVELGADCYLGIFAAHVDNQNRFGQELGDAAGTLRTAVVSVFFSGHTYKQWFDPGVHGTPRERAIAFKVGVLTEDPAYCRAYAEYTPKDPVRLDSYSMGMPPGTQASFDEQRATVRFADIVALVRARPDLPAAPAEQQIANVLRWWFGGMSWRPSGPLQDTQADPTFGGSTAVQPYTLEEASGPSYGAVMLHVADSGGGLVLDVRTRGRLDEAGAEAFQPIGDFLYALLAHTCPPGTNEVVCTQPLGSRD